MQQDTLDKLVNNALAIEIREAKEAGALGYMGRALVQATMPHKRISGNEFTRKNGNFTLIMLAPSEIGLPYGSIPRLLMAWIATEIVRTKQRELVLGRSLSDFMSQLGLVPTGGKWGSITRLREQMKRLFSCSISCTYTNDNDWSMKNITPVSQVNLWWNTDKDNTFTSTLVLNKDFFQEIMTNPIPIDLRALKALKRSPMALDIYCWLTYRMSYLRKKTEIPWFVLQRQFGAGYERTRDFKRYFLSQLRYVHTIYPEAKLIESDSGLILRPSKSHIPIL